MIKNNNNLSVIIKKINKLNSSKLNNNIDSSALNRQRCQKAINGSIVNIGLTGLSRLRGPTGLDGSAVNTDATGPTGPIGLIGPTGLDGSAVNTGATGPTGPLSSINSSIIVLDISQITNPYTLSEFRNNTTCIFTNNNSLAEKIIIYLPSINISGYQIYIYFTNSTIGELVLFTTSPNTFLNIGDHNEIIVNNNCCAVLLSYNDGYYNLSGIGNVQPNTNGLKINKLL